MFEMEDMVEKLKVEPGKIPAPSHDEIMKMMDAAYRSLQVDTKKAFKSLGLTNKLDGSEDHLISDRNIQLIGPRLFEFCENLMKQKSQKILKDLLKTITPPKGSIVQDI